MAFRYVHSKRFGSIDCSYSLPWPTHRIQDRRLKNRLAARRPYNSRICLPRAALVFR
jgi:hypothetical protein